MPKRAQFRRTSSDSDLDDLADRLILASCSSYSKQSTCALNSFVRTCTAHGWPVLPVSEEVLTMYAAYRYMFTNNIGASFRKELYGIRQASYASESGWTFASTAR